MLFIEATTPMAVRRPTPLRPANSREPPGVVRTRSHRAIASRISRNRNTSVSRYSARYRPMPRSTWGTSSLVDSRDKTRPAGGSVRRPVVFTQETKYESKFSTEVTCLILFDSSENLPRSEPKALDDQSFFSVFSIIWSNLSWALLPTRRSLNNLSAS